MIKRWNINIIRNTDTRSKTLAASMLAMATLIAMMSIVISTNEHIINAQMMGDHGGFGNMTSGLQEDRQENASSL